MERILVAGDWHGNDNWALSVIEQARDALPGEESPLILHLGDFGVWPGKWGQSYLAKVNAALERAGAELWFIDGNHEDFAQLRDARDADELPPPVRVRDRVRWLNRGYRWNWHGRVWVACGGAVSVDKVFRQEGVDWWPQEFISLADEHHICRGVADVMVCHDAPRSVPLSLPPPPKSWDSADLKRAERHRELLQEIVDDVKPSHLLHGHYHLSHESIVDMKHGPVKVTGLDRDGEQKNCRVLNIETMEWES